MLEIMVMFVVCSAVFGGLAAAADYFDHGVNETLTPQLSDLRSGERHRVNEED